MRRHQAQLHHRGWRHPTSRQAPFCVLGSSADRPPTRRALKSTPHLDYGLQVPSVGTPAWCCVCVTTRFRFARVLWPSQAARPSAQCGAHCGGVCRTSHFGGWPALQRMYAHTPFLRAAWPCLVSPRCAAPGAIQDSLQGWFGSKHTGREESCDHKGATSSTCLCDVPCPRCAYQPPKRPQTRRSPAFLPHVTCAP